MLSFGSILIVLYCVFALLGLVLFRDVLPFETTAKRPYFNNFPTAFMSVLQISTGDSWNSLMNALMVSEPVCSNEMGNCGHRWLTPAYFILLTCSSCILLSRLFAAVVISNLEKEDILAKIPAREAAAKASKDAAKAAAATEAALAEAAESAILKGEDQGAKTLSTVVPKIPNLLLEADETPSSLTEISRNYLGEVGENWVFIRKRVVSREYFVKHTFLFYFLEKCNYLLSYLLSRSRLFEYSSYSTDCFIFVN